MKTVSTGQAFSKELLGTFFPLLFPPILQLLSPILPLLTKYWADHRLFVSESCG